ncbi:hypothetical protein KAU32_10310 [bacterium]|nr:hypothetical protein [bacterium]
MKERKGSILMLVIVILAGVQLLSLIYIGVVKSYKRSVQYSNAVDNALYNAEEGLNSVINILMRDEDWDFRSAGSKTPSSGFANTIPYAFNFESMDFNVQVLSENSNPITDMTGVTEPEFNTKEHCMWVKVTGYYYPQEDPQKWISLAATGSDTTALWARIAKRTVIAKITSAMPLNPFESAIFSCGEVDAGGGASIDGKVCAPTVSGTIGANADTECAPTAAECVDIVDQLTGWAEDICAEAYEEGHGYTGAKTMLVTSFSGLSPSGVLDGKYCFEEDVSWGAGVDGVTPVDLNGDMDYSDEGMGEVAPPIMIIKGNLTMTGTPDFKGIVLVMGEYSTTNANLLSGDENFQGTVVSFDSLALQGGAEVGFMDFSKYINVNRNKVSRSGWVIADKPVKMEYPEASGTYYNIEVAHLAPPNPTTWH